DRFLRADVVGSKGGGDLLVPHAHPLPAAPAQNPSLQQCAALTWHASARSGEEGVIVGTQRREVAFELLPVDVPGVGILDEHRPVVACDPEGSPGLEVYTAHLSRAPVHIGSGIA